MTLEKNGSDSEKVWKMGKKWFFIHQIQKKKLCGINDVLPQLVCSMALIGMELLGTLEGYLSSATFNY